MTKRELIESASAKAERIFNATGKMFPMWHAFLSDGSERVIPPPPVDDKDVASVAIRVMLRMLDAVAVIFIDEAWMRIVKVKADSPEGRAALDDAREHGVRNHPDRIECVMFYAEDGTGSTTAWRRIVRKVNSRPRLGPLELNEDIHASEGRFVGLLPQRGATTH